MSIEGKHAYRFGFLKSEEWQNIRLACLARDKAKCRICDKEDISNDVHHIEYPDNWYLTKVWHVRTLCRECHDAVHRIMEERPELSWKQLKSRAGKAMGLNVMTGVEYAKRHFMQETDKRYQLTVMGL